jgi:hypothetical protein
MHESGWLVAEAKFIDALFAGLPLIETQFQEPNHCAYISMDTPSHIGKHRNLY